MTTSTSTSTSTGDEPEPIYVIKGLWGRPVREWLYGVLPLMVLSYMAIVDHNWFLIILAAFFVVLFLVPFACGRIELFPDRLWIRSWSGLGWTYVIPLQDLRRVVVDKSTFRIGYVADDKSKQVLVLLLAPVAEELYDQTLEQLERDPGLRDRLEEQGPTRFVVAAAAE